MDNRQFMLGIFLIGVGIGIILMTIINALLRGILLHVV